MNLNKVLPVLIVAVVVGVGAWFVSADVTRNSMEASVFKSTNSTVTKPPVVAGQMATSKKPPVKPLGYVVFKLYIDIHGNPAFDCWDRVDGQPDRPGQPQYNSDGTVTCNFDAAPTAPHSSAGQK